ncbi:hypothetical protein ACONUD_16360 [Microbulbifer harenosus]|uniref:O-antigen ligase domain-containing protein n=1 Tax=Microbulbifer harenosus TaxID=2576840 RepID=A0ABY2UEX0_9GAMM|nr:hypothetical protein [Microbulbifer harenosus]TLM75625.1 hypothetical protein FDY93_15105 [Microbulbifer harenosus]
MFLPQKVEFVLPLIPNIEKENIAAYCTLIGCLAVRRIRFRLLSGARAAKVVVLLGLMVPTFTVLTNLDPVFTGVQVKQALSPKDTLSMTLQFVFTLVPFVLAALLVKDFKDGVKILRLLAIAGLIYSPLMLIEVLLSPQLHTWIYGFFPHAFDQQIRFGGYRPVVFMGHGLIVANFTVAVLIAITALFKIRQKILFIPNVIYLFYGFFLLLVCKSVGAWLLGFLGLTLLVFFPSRLSMLIAFILACTVFLYPVLAIFDYIPRESLLDLAETFGSDRAASLEFRFNHEEIMLAHGKDKLLFGWGGWDRNRIDGAVTDGYWIIIFTQFGLLGYLVYFGLPMLAVMNGKKEGARSRSPLEKQVSAAFCVLIAMLMIDQIPNASQHSWVFFLYGAATGLFASKREAAFSKGGSHAKKHRKHQSISHISGEQVSREYGWIEK